MAWTDVLKVVIPLLVALLMSSKLVMERVNQGKRLSFLGGVAMVVYYRVEWEKTLAIGPIGWDGGNLSDPTKARMRAQGLIRELCESSGQEKPSVKETEYLDALFVNLSKASKYVKLVPKV